MKNFKNYLGTSGTLKKFIFISFILHLIIFIISSNINIKKDDSTDEEMAKYQVSLLFFESSLVPVPSSNNNVKKEIKEEKEIEKVEELEPEVDEKIKEEEVIELEEEKETEKVEKLEPEVDEEIKEEEVIELEEEKETEKVEKLKPEVEEMINEKEVAEFKTVQDKENEEIKKVKIKEKILKVKDEIVEEIKQIEDEVNKEVNEKVIEEPNKSEIAQKNKSECNKEDKEDTIENKDISRIDLTEQYNNEKVTPPSLVNYTKPEYPKNLKKRKIQGRVVVKALVDIKGRVIEEKIFKSSGYKQFDNAALKAVNEWKFVPAEISGQKVESWILIPVRFTLNS
ncbi:MAG: energy transducer TonB [Halanaerobiales bacterium]|nr:energy transducer TonB [Halanaerobiales bacterium]